MYAQLASPIERMQPAYERVLLGESEPLGTDGQYEADVGFLTDQFLRRQPFDLLESLRRSQPIPPSQPTSHSIGANRGRTE